MARAAFDYRLRENHRSRYVRLRVSAERGLEIIVPKGFDAADIPRLLEQKKRWIEAAFERVESDRRLLGVDAPWQPPTCIELSAINRTWFITVQACEISRVMIREVATDRLVLRGPIENEAACRRALTRWLARQAYANLIPQLDTLSRALGLRYKRAYIKRQRTRWGSCSSRKAITLNAKLLFLPPVLVRSVMIHELCHLIEMNHSGRFWRLVQQYDSEFRFHDKQLDEAWKCIPRWAT